MTAYIDIVAGTGMIMGQDIWGTIDEQLHEATPELGLGLQDLIRELTPIRTGALLMDISFEAYTDPGDSDLVWMYPEDTAQEAFWNRIYVQYQEGGPLGEHTYTNDPHEMFYETATGAGLDFTKSWAELHIQEAIDLCMAGAGVPF
jgi:hypothetical protein